MCRKLIFWALINSYGQKNLGKSFTKSLRFSKTREPWPIC